MERQTVLERMSTLLASQAENTANTSMRIPSALREAASLAVSELGVAPSTTALTTAALRSALEAVLMQAALDDHYRQYPLSRPSLGDLAVAAAEMDGNPLAAHPDMLHNAAAEIVTRHPAATPEDVILWAEARNLSAS
jgi:hypothetical protein